MRSMTSWPITLTDVLRARQRLRHHISPTPLRHYAPLDAAVGHDIRVLVKHENHCPTNAFKARNGLSLLSAMSPEARARGVVAATRGNHGQGVAWAATLFGAPATIFVPRGNNPEKNEAMRAYGAKLIEAGDDYDAALANAKQLVADRGMTMAHSTNDPNVIAGAATFSLEIFEQEPDVDALVIAVGGGSQAVGALTVARALHPTVPVYGVQAERASAIHDSWHAKRPLTSDSADTFADGLATRQSYALTFDALCEGLKGFITVSDAAIADAVRLLLRTTHNLAEGAGAAGLAGLLALRDELRGKTVGVILSGSNIDSPTLQRVLAGEI